MPDTKLKIVSISSETDPYSRTGGLADVARSLPKALKRLGHDVIAITPLYGQIIDKKKHKLELIYKNVNLVIDKTKTLKINYWQGFLMENLPIYFIECKKYFSRKKTLYGSSKENKRFFVFDLACLNLIRLLKFYPDIIHCHDWQTGLVPYYLKNVKRFKANPVLNKAATVFTIHNLAFQLGHDWWTIPSKKRDDGRSQLPLFNKPQIENINFAKRAIINSDIINAVSEQYSEEILTKDFGADLNVILKNRKDKLLGIINGIDYHEYNPATDPGLARNFNFNKIHRKAQNKLAVQKHFKLAQNPNLPLLVMTSRITEQKGFDLLTKIFDALMKSDLQLIIMGDGDKKYINLLKKYKNKLSKKFVLTPFDRKRETSLYAGGDILLLPSQFEPCGLNQMIALRYGCIPIVRHIGGLADTITDFNPKTKKGNGFVFKRYHSLDFLIAIIRAIETYKNPELWHKIVEQGMKKSFSWEIPAKKYVLLYKKAIKFKTSNHKKATSH